MMLSGQSRRCCRIIPALLLLTLASLSHAQVVNFQPSGVSGLVEWLDASEPATLIKTGTRGAVTAYATTTGDNVIEWDDKSGNNNDVKAPGTAPTLTTGAFLQPRLNSIVATGLRDLPGVTFSDSAACPLRSTNTVFTSGMNQAMTLFIVKTGTPAGSTEVLVSDAGSHFYIENDSGLVGFTAGSTSAGTAYAPSGTSLPNNSLSIEHLVYNGVTSDMSINGLRLIFPRTGNIGFTGNALTVGSYGGGTGFPWGGKIGEILIYNRALTATEVAKIYAYLAYKWNIPVTVGTQVVCSGNSLTAGYNAATALNYAGQDYPTQMSEYFALNSGLFTVLPQGVSGITTKQLLSSGRSSAGPGPTNNQYQYSRPSCLNNDMVHWEITNDINDGTNGQGHNPVAVFNDEVSFCQKRQQEGYTVFIVTCLPRATGVTTFNQDRLDVNSAIRQLYNTSGSQSVVVNGNTYTGGATPFASGIIDIGSDTTLSGDWTAGSLLPGNSTTVWTVPSPGGYWQYDGVHLTPQGYNYFASRVYNVLLPTINTVAKAGPRRLH